MAMPMLMSPRHQIRSHIPGLFLIMFKHLFQSALAALPTRAQPARRITFHLSVSLRCVAFAAGRGAASADAAGDGTMCISCRQVIVGVGVSGTSTGCEKGIGRGAGEAPRFRGGLTLIRAWIGMSTRTSGVDAPVPIWLRAFALSFPEVNVAAGLFVAGAADHGDGEAEDDRYVPKWITAIEITLEDGALLAADMNLAVKVGAEVGAALCFARLAVI